MLRREATCARLLVTVAARPRPGADEVHRSAQLGFKVSAKMRARTAGAAALVRGFAWPGERTCCRTPDEQHEMLARFSAWDKPAGSPCASVCEGFVRSRIGPPRQRIIPALERGPRRYGEPLMELTAAQVHITE